MTGTWILALALAVSALQAAAMATRTPDPELLLQSESESGSAAAVPDDCESHRSRLACDTQPLACHWVKTMPGVEPRCQPRGGACPGCISSFTAVWSIFEECGCNGTAGPWTELTVKTCAPYLLGDGFNWGPTVCNPAGTHVTVTVCPDTDVSCDKWPLGRDTCQNHTFPVGQCLDDATERGYSSFRCVKEYKPVGPGAHYRIDGYNSDTCKEAQPAYSNFFQDGCHNGCHENTPTTHSFSLVGNKTDLNSFVHEEVACGGNQEQNFHFKLGAGCVNLGGGGVVGTYFP